MSYIDTIITANSLNEAILKLQTLLPIQVRQQCSETGKDEVVYSFPQVFGYDVVFDNLDEVQNFLNNKIESSNITDKNICYHVCKLTDNKYIYKTNDLFTKQNQ